MSDLQVETSVLREAGSSLRRVYTEFKDAHNAACPPIEVWPIHTFATG